MFDATGKVPSGILKGNLVELGNFEQCIAIDATVENGTITGKYCYGKLSLTLNENTKYLKQRTPSIVSIFCLFLIHFSNYNVVSKKCREFDEEQNKK